MIYLPIYFVSWQTSCTLEKGLKRFGGDHKQDLFSVRLNMNFQYSHRKAAISMGLTKIAKLEYIISLSLPHENDNFYYIKIITESHQPLFSLDSCTACKLINQIV